jgi:hypothetical protein
VDPAPVLQQLVRNADTKTNLTFRTEVGDVLDEANLKA